MRNLISFWRKVWKTWFDSTLLCNRILNIFTQFQFKKYWLLIITRQQLSVWILFAPCKGIQVGTGFQSLSVELGFWIPIDSGFWILWTVFWISKAKFSQIPDSVESFSLHPRQKPWMPYTQKAPFPRNNVFFYDCTSNQLTWSGGL